MVTGQELQQALLALIAKLTEALPPHYTVVMEVSSTDYAYSIVRETDKWGNHQVFPPAMSSQGEANFLQSVVVDINKLRAIDGLPQLTP